MKNPNRFFSQRMMIGFCRFMQNTTPFFSDRPPTQSQSHSTQYDTKSEKIDFEAELQRTVKPKIKTKKTNGSSIFEPFSFTAVQIATINIKTKP